MKTADIHIIYQPLITQFTVIPKGGSVTQHYDATRGSYTPDRSLIPLAMQPSLQVTDPDNVIATGDYSTEIVNPQWYLGGSRIFDGQKDDSGKTICTISATGVLLLYANIPTGTTSILRFAGQYLDKRRNEVIELSYTTELGCITYQDKNLKLNIDVPAKLLLSPFRDTGKRTVNAQLVNGTTDTPDDKTTYKWMYHVSGAWRPIGVSDPWYESGSDSKQLVVRQSYIGNILIKCVANCSTLNMVDIEGVIRLRRYYGQYTERLDITEGKYIDKTTTHSSAAVTITNREGDIISPCNYFDIGIWFCRAYRKSSFFLIDHGTEASISKEMIGSDYEGKPTFGVEVKELSHKVPLLCGGVPVTLDGKVVFVQVPANQVISI